ncbi:MerR family transcriptional regulator [Niveibacterium sp. SC-1]|uniref:MerR family transcriptional regulator n=1 Tax=Niveibacterium sp. SC-1 TaxID=3135646 RepID=UPI00311DA4C6
MSTVLTIQAVAARTGLSAHTLRYYERIGLIDGPVRNSGGHRVYRDDDLIWIAFLVRLRSTGMPIRQMQAYAALRREGDTLDSVSGRKALMREHTLALEAELAALQENLAVLRDKIAHYDSLEHRLQSSLQRSAGQTPANEEEHANHPRHRNPRTRNKRSL